MGKKKSAGNASAKAAKKVKATQKIEKRDKKTLKSKDEEEDLEGILEKMQQEWEAAHTITEELVEGPPSRRAYATLTACPSGKYLWFIGGEFLAAHDAYYFYNDVFRYTPEKDEWRKFVSPTCPGPRSAHAVVATPMGGGKLFLFGGEFSSLHQNTFHHYRDFWCFDVTAHSWDRIDTKVRPSARSGHRMAVWKHYIVLFGGFYDPGITTRYLNDLWLFDTQGYKWHQVEFKDVDRKPSPRSGFSFLPTPDGIVLHGGYCKEYVKGKRPVGVMLEDTWFLNMSLTTAASPGPSNAKSSSAFPVTVQWERRKRPSTAYAPSLRIGCTMTLWAAKNMGILFGGVTDEDTGEETLESVFWNDLNGLQLTGNGRWVSMTLRRPKKKGSGPVKKKKGPEPALYLPHANQDDQCDEEGADSDTEDQLKEVKSVFPEHGKKQNAGHSMPDPDVDLNDPNLSIPLPRYNAMLAVLRNSLYIYGGIYERGSREYTLDDFYSLQLDKLDQYTCLKESGIVITEGDVESSSDDDGDDDDEDDDDEEDDGGDGELVKNEGTTQEEGDRPVDGTSMDNNNVKTDYVAVEKREAQDALRSQATEFMGIAKDTGRSAEDITSTPLPGETLAMFYARSREYWAQKAHTTSDNRGKSLRRDGFTLAEERYGAYKPILDEVEKILAEAGLDEEEMRRGAAGGSAGGTGQSRNRR